MSKYSKEDIIRMVREDDVEFIRMQFTDIFGQLKNVAITASQIEKAVNDQIMIDGSSIEGFVRINESDQYLRPDLDTFAILPWRPQHGKVARLICDVYNPDGTPFAGDPRGVLKKMLKRPRTWVIPSTWARRWSFSFSRRMTRVDPQPPQAMKQVTLTWAPWIMGKAPGGKSA